MLRQLIDSPTESERLEFKEARASFDTDKVYDYCCALYNEGGGRLILGISDKPPRQVVGTQAFQNTLDRLKHDILSELKIRVNVEELQHPDGRVLVFTAPPRMRGHVLAYKGRYRMRSGSSLVNMTEEYLRRMFDEASPDFSAELCQNATLANIDPVALMRFRTDWQRRSSRHPLPESDRLLLEDAGLMHEGRLTYAALILLGTERALAALLSNAEIVFEYRSDDNAIAHDERVDLRHGFLSIMDRLWTLIDRRNPEGSFQEGLYRHSIRAFNEEAVREAILNAVSHRDYRHGGSIFIKQYPARLVITSPGGFPDGISADNVIFRQNPRNRRLAEAFQRCGLVERSGQGADRMFRAALREGKLPPDFSRSDTHQVELELHGQIRNPNFVRFLERLSQETDKQLGVNDLLVLDAVDRGQPIAEPLRQRLGLLIDLGAIERRGRNKFILGVRFYAAVGDPSEYTRRRGLDHETNKALLLEHIRRFRERGSPMEELEQVLPSLTRPQVRKLVYELRDRGAIIMTGKTRSARWFPSDPNIRHADKSG